MVIKLLVIYVQDEKHLFAHHHDGDVAVDLGMVEVSFQMHIVVKHRLAHHGLSQDILDHLRIKTRTDQVMLKLSASVVEYVGELMPQFYSVASGNSRFRVCTQLRRARRTLSVRCSALLIWMLTASTLSESVATVIGANLATVTSG